MLTIFAIFMILVVGYAIVSLFFIDILMLKILFESGVWAYIVLFLVLLWLI